MWIKILCIEYILRGIPTIESTFDVTNMVKTATVKDVPMNNDGLLNIQAHEKKIGHRDCSQWAHGDQSGHSQPWLSCDLAMTEPWSYWRCRDWAVTLPWLSCDLAVTELWARRDWAVTFPSRDWAMIIGPGAVTTVVTVSSR